MKQCPRCNRPVTDEGQPSKRLFFACGSYLYEGDTDVRNQTELCEALTALNDAAELLAEIMRDEVNAQDEAEKWLREYAPEKLFPPDQTPTLPGFGETLPEHLGPVD